MSPQSPTCIAAPVHVEGRVPGGDLFYFRSRHGDACLAVGGPDPADVAPWERCLPHPDARYLPASDGVAIMQNLAQAYTDAQPDRNRK